MKNTKISIYVAAYLLTISATIGSLEAQVPAPNGAPDSTAAPTASENIPAKPRPVATKPKPASAGLSQQTPMLQQASSGTPEDADLCVFRDELAKETNRTSARETQIANKAHTLLKSIDAITGKATKADVPLNKQLAPTDLLSFSMLQKQLGPLQVSELLEHRRERDLLVINRMVAIADQSYRYGIEPSEGSPDFRILSSLRLVRSALEQKPLQVGLPANECGVDRAIFNLQRDAIAKIEKFDLTKVSQLSDQLRIKYKMGPRIDREKLSQDDQQDWDEVARNIAVPVERARSFLLDLEASRILFRASDIIYGNYIDDSLGSF